MDVDLVELEISELRREWTRIKKGMFYLIKEKNII